MSAPFIIGPTIRPTYKINREPKLLQFDLHRTNVGVAEVVRVPLDTALRTTASDRVTLRWEGRTVTTTHLVAVDAPVWARAS